MSYLKNKLQEKISKYLRRKNKVNAKIKALNPEFRLLIQRSNLYVKAQVLGADGVVIATKLKELLPQVKHLLQYLKKKRLKS